MLRSLISPLTLAVLVSGPAIAETEARVIAEFPSGAFLENLEVSPTGEIAFTNYFARQIGMVTAEGTLRVLADLPAHPVGVLRIEPGYVVTAHGAPFTGEQDFTQTQQILLLDDAGTVTQTLPVDDALFLNGMTKLSTGAVLIADSIAGTIWHLDLDTSTVSPWLQHELLAQNPDLPAFAPGANGVKRDGARILISNSGRGALYAVALSEDGSTASEPELVARTGAIDDFAIDGDRIVFTTHGASLLALEPDGQITTLLADGCDGCTSVARVGNEYVVLTTGGLLEGHSDPARILAVQAE